MPHYSYNGPLPKPATYNLYDGMKVPNKLVWTNDTNIQLQMPRPLIPDGTINDRTEFGPFRTDYSPYFWDKYKPRNMY